MEEIINAIYNRKNLPYKMIYLSQLLKANGAEEYNRVCANRISEFIDMEHVAFDVFNDCDIMLDHKGLEECRNILEGYVSKETVNKYIECIEARNDLIDAYNAYFKILREADSKTIKNLLKEPQKYFDENKTERTCKMLEIELMARKPYIRIINQIKTKIGEVLFYVRNYEVLSVVNRIVKRCVAENTEV